MTDQRNLEKWSMWVFPLIVLHLGAGATFSVLNKEIHTEASTHGSWDISGWQKYISILFSFWFFIAHRNGITGRFNEISCLLVWLRSTTPHTRGCSPFSVLPALRVDSPHCKFAINMLNYHLFLIKMQCLISVAVVSLMTKKLTEPLLDNPSSRYDVAGGHRIR